jgi:hypothetical protein
MVDLAAMATTIFARYQERERNEEKEGEKQKKNEKQQRRAPL